MLYIKVLAAVVSVGAGVRVDDVAVADTESQKDLLQSLENKVIERMMGQNMGASAVDGTPVTNAAFTTEVTDLVAGMAATTKKNHATAQGNIDTAFAKFATCEVSYKTQMVGVTTARESFTKENKLHKTCRTGEETVWLIQDTCNKNVDVLAGEVQHCKASILTDTTSVEDACNEKSKETELEWLTRVEAKFTSLKTGWQTKIADCEKKEEEYNKTALECKTKTKTYEDKKTACDIDGGKMDTAGCEAASTSISACNTKQTVYANVVTAYNLAKEKAAKEEKDNMVEHRLWSRIKCLLTALGTETAGTSDSAKLDACISAKYSTDEVKLDVKPIPAMPVCAIHHAAPCTEDYKTDTYTPLPEHSKGQCNTCSLPAVTVA